MPHILSIEQSFLASGEGVAVCSCGSSIKVVGGTFAQLLAAGEDWHAAHVTRVGGEAQSFTELTGR